MQQAISIGLLMSMCCAASATAQDGTAIKDSLATDLEMLQGTWELQAYDAGADGESTQRVIKTIKGNVTETLRFRSEDNKWFRTHSSRIQLTKAGPVRILLWVALGDSREDGSPSTDGSRKAKPGTTNPKQRNAYVYKVDGENFWEIRGAIYESRFDDSRAVPRVFHWKKISLDGEPSAE